MSPARLWLTLFMAGFAAIAALLVVTLLTPVPYGDLSRTGLLSEHAFGWRVDQPHIDPKYLRGSPPGEADILIIGDSFSMSYSWQSVLTHAGYSVSTTYWGQLDEALCSDFDAWLDRAHFHGRLVIVESVERLLPERLENSRKCEHMKEPFGSDANPYHTYPEQVPGFELNWKAKISSGYITYQNTRKAKKSARAIWSYKTTLVRPVPNGCALFSHLSCNKALFFGEDEMKRELTKQDVDRMRAFNQTHRVRPILWVIIPNKTTTYLQPDHSRDFAATLARSDLGPELFSYAIEQKTKMRDFYFPNDTHLSTHGQLALGQRVLEWVGPLVPPRTGDPRIATPRTP